MGSSAIAVWRRRAIDECVKELKSKVIMYTRDCFFFYIKKTVGRLVSPASNLNGEVRFDSLIGVSGDFDDENT